MKFVLGYFLRETLKINAIKIRSGGTPLPNVFACATSMPTSQQNVCVLLSLL